MMAFLILAAAVAGSALIVAWRRRERLGIAAGLSGLAGALALAAWLIGPRFISGEADTPNAWLVESAMAFNKPDLLALQGATGAITQAAPLPELADRLAARLEKSPDDAAGWMLLATTYRQLGREPDAAAAERRASEAVGGPVIASDLHWQTMSAPGTAAMHDATATGPSLATQYVREGQRLRVQRKFSEAAQAFRGAVEADPTDADSWADLADSAAAAAGNDLTVGRKAIQQALAIDPRHRKALWLRASLELQERNFTAAAVTWRTLEALVAPGSPDARVISANIAEAEALAADSRRKG